MRFRRWDWIGRVFWFWYGTGLVLMLLGPVPKALAFSNGLFLFWFALYACTVYAKPQEGPTSLRLRPSSLRGAAAIFGTAAGSFVLEGIGVKTGWPFGSYRYTGLLGAGWAGVPAAVSAAWVGVVVTALVLASPVSRSRWSRALLTGAWALAFDLVLDPVAFARGFWIWEEPGRYYGVPFHNFLAWFAAAALFSLLFPWRETQARQVRQARRLLQAMLLLFGLLALKEGLLAPAGLAAVWILTAEWGRKDDTCSSKSRVQDSVQPL